LRRFLVGGNRSQVNGTGRNVIGLSKAAIIVDQELGDQKQGNASGARGRAFYPRQDGMNDVFSQAMTRTMGRVAERQQCRTLLYLKFRTGRTRVGPE
jgi:hypothetical protein